MKAKLPLLVSLAALGLASCSGGSSSETTEDSTGTEETSETATTASTTTSIPGDSSTATSSSEPEIQTYWTDEDLALMDTYLGGHYAPWLDLEANGITAYLFSYDAQYDVLFLDLFYCSLETKDAYGALLTSNGYADETAYYSGVPDGYSIYNVTYDDLWTITQEVGFYDADTGDLTTEDVVGIIEVAIYATEPAYSWPASTIAYYFNYYTGIDATDTLPAPGALDTGISYIVEMYVGYDDDWNYIYFAQVTAAGDLSGYGEILDANGFTYLPGVNTSYGDYYLYSDGSYGVAIDSSYYATSGMTYICIMQDGFRSVAWPTNTVANAIANITGNPDSSTLPALEGGDFYVVTDYSVYGMVYIDVYTDGTGISAEDYVNELLEQGFYANAYISDEYYYADPEGEYQICVADYTESFGYIDIFIQSADGYVSSWPAELISSWLEANGVTGVAVPAPAFDWQFGIVYDFSGWYGDTPILNIDLTDLKDDGTLGVHADEFNDQMLSEEGWTAGYGTDHYGTTTYGFADSTGQVFVYAENYYDEATSIYIIIGDYSDLLDDTGTSDGETSESSGRTDLTRTGSLFF